ncbi:ABC-2 transporter permease [Gordonibacter sp.]|uniref:ABC-2 transporter permease n=1 Tax=Gordonibacter sp. TaxID=1968902 RepID=UPI002FC6F560
MKTILLSDLLSLMGSGKIRQQAIGFFILGTICSVAIGNLPAIAGFPALIMPLSSLQMLMYADGRRDWEGFRLVLPVTRKAVVIGRYATLPIVVAISFAVGAAIYATGSALTYLLPGISNFALAAPVAFNGLALVATLGACCLVLSFVLSVALPLFLRLGALKVPFIVSAIPGLVVMLGFYAAMPYLREWMALLTDPSQTILFSGIALAVALGLYAVSAAVSMKLYLTRDF